MDPTAHYPRLSQWPLKLGPAPTRVHLIQAFALLRAAKLSKTPEGTHDALAVAAHLGAWWWPGQPRKPGGLRAALDAVVEGGAASDRRNVITQAPPEGLKDSGLVIVHSRRVNGLKEFFCELTREGEAVVVRYRGD